MRKVLTIESVDVARILLKQVEDQKVKKKIVINDA